MIDAANSRRGVVRLTGRYELGHVGRAAFDQAFQGFVERFGVGLLKMRLESVAVSVALDHCPAALDLGPLEHLEPFIARFSANSCGKVRDVASERIFAARQGRALRHHDLGHWLVSFAVHLHWQWSLARRCSVVLAIDEHKAHKFSMVEWRAE
nr:hypothetical protein [Croceicoccus hydrothermalis]